MSAMARNKGLAAERELGHVLTDHNLDYIRPQSGRTQAADFAIGPYRLECRRRERLLILAWSKEIEDKTPAHLVPVLAYRTNREPWRASLLFSDWAELVKAA